MAFNWREYLFFARFTKDLADKDFSREASQRCAVSRAYFAAFCCARNFAVANGFVIRDGDDRAKIHTQIREHFRKDAPRRHLAGSLDRLRQWRNNCDYDNEVPNIEFVVEGSFREAEKILDSVK